MKDSKENLTKQEATSECPQENEVEASQKSKIRKICELITSKYIQWCPADRCLVHHIRVYVNYSP